MIETVTVASYPIRYAAVDNQVAWVESTHELAGTPGHEAASFHEPNANPAYPDDCAGIHVRIVNHASRKTFYADCHAYGPNQYRRQSLAGFEGPTLEDVKQQAEVWITKTARPWVQGELANQCDRVEVIDRKGTRHLGSLWGVAADSMPHGARVELDSPEAYEGQIRSNGIVWVEWSRMRRTGHTVRIMHVASSNMHDA